MYTSASEELFIVAIILLLYIYMVIVYCVDTRHTVCMLQYVDKLYIIDVL